MIFVIWHKKPPKKRAFCTFVRFANCKFKENAYICAVFYYLMKNILLFLALFIAACWSCKDDHQSADVDQSAKYDHIVDELCHSYIDTTILRDKHYVLEYSFKKDGTVHLIYYSDRNFDNELEIDSMLFHWELPHTPEATSDGYELYDVALVYYPEENLPANLIERYKDSIDFSPITDSQPIMVTPEQEVVLLIEEEDGMSAQTRGFFDSLLDAGKKLIDGVVETGKTGLHILKQSVNIVTKPVTIVKQAIDIVKDIIFEGFGPMEYKDWMKNIDGSKPICMLSIPGTHDTFTFNTGLSAALAGTQKCGIGQQWDLGVRCFDIRLEYDYTNFFRKLSLTHGGFVYLDYMMDGAFDEIKERLDANSSETAILIIKFDEENGRKDAANAELDKFLHERIEKEQIVKWRKDLTLEEARGKFIVIARYLPADSLVREYVPMASGWGDNKSDQYLRMLKPNDPKASAVDSTRLWVQDRYEQHDGEDKDDYVAIKNRMISESFMALNNEYANDNVWAFNHTSGYVRAVTNVSSIESIVGGIVNSEFVSSHTIPYTEKLIKSYDDYTTGVIMIDYAGVGVGQTLPETVLKKNY